MPGTTLVVTAKPNSAAPEAMQAYLQGVLPLLMNAGGKLVKRLKVSEVIHADASFGMALVMEFPDRDRVVGMFESDDYKALIPHRDRGFTSMNIALADAM